MSKELYHGLDAFHKIDKDKYSENYDKIDWGKKGFKCPLGYKKCIHCGGCKNGET